MESGYIKWKYHDEKDWNNLIDLRTLTGAKGDKGEDGKEVKFNVTQEYIQWKYDGDSSWRNLIALSLITGEKGDKGDAGSEVELTVESGYIKWKYHDEDEWSNLIDINSLIGEKGDKGDDGKEVLFNVSSTHIQWKYQGESSWNDLVELSILKGEKGDKGEDAKTVEFRVNGKWVQWTYTSDDEWINLYEVNGNIAPTGLAHVKFVLNGGSMEGYQSEMDVTMGYSIELPTSKKHGYTFLGWYENTSDEYAVPNTYRVHESINLYAKWEAGAVITGTKIYNLKEYNDMVEKLQSIVDPESGMFVKGEHERQFAYVDQVACDRHGWILGFDVNPGNIHDSEAFLPFFENKLLNFNPSIICAEAGYANGLIAHFVQSHNSHLLVPYTRPKGKDTESGKDKFDYYFEIDQFMCPNHKMLVLWNITKVGNIKYKIHKVDCGVCPYKDKCIKNYAFKTITRHIYDDCMLFAKDLRLSDIGKEIYSQRK